MKRFYVFATVASFVVCCFLFAGCGMKKVETSQQAIEAAEKMTNDIKKADYLLVEARIFMKNRNFQGAIDVSQYVIHNLKNKSAEANDIIQKAYNAIAVETKMAEERARKEKEEAREKIAGR